MASGKLNAPILGQILSNLEIQGRNYFDVMLGLVPDLCSDIVLGQSFMNKHKELTFKLNGAQEGLVIQNPIRCGVATSNVNSPEYIVTSIRTQNQLPLRADGSTKQINFLLKKR